MFRAYEQFVFDSPRLSVSTATGCCAVGLLLPTVFRPSLFVVEHFCYTVSGGRRRCSGGGGVMAGAPDVDNTGAYMGLNENTLE